MTLALTSECLRGNISTSPIIRPRERLQVFLVPTQCLCLCKCACVVYRCALELLGDEEMLPEGSYLVESFSD